MTIFSQPPILDHEKLRLLPMEEKHATPLFALNDESLWKYTLSSVSNLEEMQATVKTALKLRSTETGLPFVVQLKESGRIVGSTRIYNLDFVNKSCEVGSTWYALDYQRSFVNTACKLTLLNYCFEELGLIRVQFKTDEKNKKSQKALERIGAKKEGLLRNERIKADGKVRNAYIFSIIKEEWPDVKTALEKKGQNIIYNEVNK